MSIIEVVSDMSLIVSSLCSPYLVESFDMLLEW